MGEDENRFNPDRTKELTPQAKELIGLFQRARNSASPQDKTALLREFVNKLHELISPGRSTWTPDDQLSGIIVEGVDKSPIPIHTGTNGQRIYFSRNKPYDGTEKSADGKVQWMFYPEPPKDDRYGGREFYNRFLENFGDEIVDMLRKID
ncbi:MAG: hypothetical protein HY395_00035 [Candidatus Doudnabacteria bacterium]|nr:hypothetical protein [Candidatus Doudnabacteria bacterium]